jgi:hypothetical protein
MLDGLFAKMLTPAKMGALIKQAGLQMQEVPASAVGPAFQSAANASQQPGATVRRIHSKSGEGGTVEMLIVFVPFPAPDKSNLTPAAIVA